MLEILDIIREYCDVTLAESCNTNKLPGIYATYKTMLLAKMVAVTKSKRPLNDVWILCIEEVMLLFTDAMTVVRMLCDTKPCSVVISYWGRAHIYNQVIYLKAVGYEIEHSWENTETASSYFSTEDPPYEHVTERANHLFQTDDTPTSIDKRRFPYNSLMYNSPIHDFI